MSQWEEDFPDDELMSSATEKLEDAEAQIPDDKGKMKAEDDFIEKEEGAEVALPKEAENRTVDGDANGRSIGEEGKETKSKEEQRADEADEENEPGALVPGILLEENQSHNHPAIPDSGVSEGQASNTSGTGKSKEDDKPTTEKKTELSEDVGMTGGKVDGPFRKVPTVDAGAKSVTNPEPKAPRTPLGTPTFLQEKADSKIPTSDDIVNEQESRLRAELEQLLKDIRRLGVKGSPEVTFGELFDDDEVANYYEALVGTLKSAKKRGLIDFEGQMLLKGPHDNVVISIKSV